jgi:uncharacterized paraquat-inducible protein A
MPQWRGILMGYLKCEKCGGYYELQEGESPDDFDLCECGGKLNHTKTFETSGEDTNENKATITCPYCGKENIEYSNYCQDCGKEIPTQTPDKNGLKEKPSTLLIVFGYIFTILGILLGGIGVLVGLVIGIILLRRGGLDRTHGIIITVLSVIIFLLVLVVGSLLVYRAYFSGPYTI